MSKHTSICSSATTSCPLHSLSALYLLSICSLSAPHADCRTIRGHESRRLLLAVRLGPAPSCRTRHGHRIIDR
eukprot:3589982-Pyramimonas_sp.AAC.2